MHYGFFLSVGIQFLRKGVLKTDTYLVAHWGAICSSFFFISVHVMRGSMACRNLLLPFGLLDSLHCTYNLYLARNLIG